MILLRRSNYREGNSMKILLVCAVGMSTSLVVSKMEKALGPDEQDWIIEAKP